MGLHIQDWMSAHTEDSREHMFQILINSKEAFCQYFTPSAFWCWETAVGFGVGDVVGVDVEAVVVGGGVVGDVGVARMPHHLLLGVGHG